MGARLAVFAFLCFFEIVLASAADLTPAAVSSIQYDPISIQIIPRAQVKSFLIGRIRTEFIRKLATDRRILPPGGNIVRDVFEQAARYPLLVYRPNQHPGARLNFTAYLRLLSLRDAEYPDPLFGDLYLLHELHHITTMPYDATLDYWAWHEKMTLNEKESTLFSEALVHLAFPKLRPLFALPQIWVDRFFNAEGIAEFQFEPLKMRQKLLSRFTAIGNSAYQNLDPIERRSWLFDRSNEIWSAIYWQYAPMIEAQMDRFYSQARKSPSRAAQELRAWILANTDSGLPFAAPNLRFQAYTAELDWGAKELGNLTDVTDFARGLVARARAEAGIAWTQRHCAEYLDGKR